MVNNNNKVCFSLKSNISVYLRKRVNPIIYWTTSSEVLSICCAYFILGNELILRNGLILGNGLTLGNGLILGNGLM